MFRAFDSGMKNLTFGLVLFSIGVLVISCEPEEEKISSSGSINLRFSTDTVIFDTLLTARTSITKRLRIFNPAKKAVSISSIRLGKGESSSYSIISNGKFGDEIRDEVLNGGDSLLVLVDVEIDPQDENLPYIVKDSIVVDWNGNSAHVKLVAWGQDAKFINGEVLCDQIWTADRPYVIYNFVAVDSACTLTMEPGTRVFLDNGATFFVQGTLKVMGDSTNRVLFRNTRFDARYQRAPGQWRGLIFFDTSRGNEIQFADIENADIGMGIGYSFIPLSDGSFFLGPEISDLTSEVSVSNTSIRNMLTAGVFAFSSDVKMDNSEVYNCGLLVGGFGGGNYTYDHCTFSNQPSDFILEDPSFQFSNEIKPIRGVDNYVLIEDLNMKIRNSIIWGPNDSELDSLDSGNAGFSFEIENSIVRSESDFGDGNFSSTERNFPGFANLFDSDFRLDSLALARDKGADLGYGFDLLGVPRDSKPDIGAYERVDK
ncbi:MAG: hypothetical protein JXR03_15155 [Cyclobacteriaceae bacterium]